MGDALSSPLFSLGMVLCLLEKHGPTIGWKQDAKPGYSYMPQ